MIVNGCVASTVIRENIPAGKKVVPDVIILNPELEEYQIKTIQEIKTTVQVLTSDGETVLDTSDTINIPLS